MTKVFSPNKDYDGVSVGVQFHNGQGETDDAKKLEWFIEHGYEVEKGSEQTSQHHPTTDEFTSNSAEFADELSVPNAYSSELSQEAETALEVHEKHAKAKKH